MAYQTGELEEAAKSNDKDSLSLFTEHFTFKFDQFIDKIYRDKLPKIRSFFDQQDERGTSFIYKLMELLQNDDRMNIARLAYYLTRLEELTPMDKRNQFRKFKEEFFEWYQGNEEERKETELALLLYVYEIRKD